MISDDSLMTDAAQDVLVDMPEDDDASLAESDPAPGRSYEPAHGSLPRLVLDALLTSSQKRLLKRGSVAVVATVPSAEWVEPLAHALRRHGSFAHIIRKTDLRPKRWNDDEDAKKVLALAYGQSVAGIAASTDRLPSGLVAAADIRLQVGTPSDRVVAGAIRAATGRTPRDMPPGIAAGLTFGELVACIRVGSSARSCIDRLVAAARSKSVVDPEVAAAPPLASLAGYGDAMTWCTDLLHDLDLWKSGAGPFPPNARVVLAGPPGTGKTTLARSLARKAGLPLIATSVGDWFATSAGNLDDVIKAVAAVWERARALAPCVVLLDELDALPNRATMSNRGKDWWLPVVTYILTSLDSAVSGATARLIIIGATNHADALDAALIRPGRLERVITIEPPKNAADRVAMLRTHLAGDLAADDLTLIGTLTSGNTGADLMAVVRDARRRARVAGRPLSLTDLMNGVAPSKTRTKLSISRAAVHEVGHAVVSLDLGMTVKTVSVVDRGLGHGGWTSTHTKIPDLPTRSDLEDVITSILAGGAAEEAFTGHRSAGSGGGDGSDIGRATYLIAGLHASFGLGDRLIYRGDPDAASALLDVDPTLRAAVEADLQRLYARALDMVRCRLREIDAVATRLIERRVLTGEQVRRIIEDLDADDRIPLSRWDEDRSEPDDAARTTLATLDHDSQP